jgi:hypothetical protein
MRQPIRGEVGNVVRLPIGGRPYQAESRFQVRAMAEAALAFERLDRFAAVLQSSSLGVRDELDGDEWPIVSFQVALPVIHQRLEQLGDVTVVNWPDAQWALRLGNARAAALLRLYAVRRSLYRSPPGTGPLDRQLAADIQALADSLLGLRRLIGEQFP